MANEARDYTQRQLIKQHFLGTYTFEMSKGRGREPLFKISVGFPSGRPSVIKITDAQGAEVIQFTESGDRSIALDGTYKLSVSGNPANVSIIEL